MIMRDATDTVNNLFNLLATGRGSRLIDWSCKNQAVMCGPQRVLINTRKRKRPHDDHASATSSTKTEVENKIMIFQPNSTCTAKTIKYTLKHVATLPTSNFPNSNTSNTADQAFWDEGGKHLATLDNTGKFLLWGAPQYTNVWRALGAVDAGSRVIKFKWLRSQDEYVSNSLNIPTLPTQYNHCKDDNELLIDLTSDDETLGNASCDSTDEPLLFVKAPAVSLTTQSGPAKPGRLDGFAVVTEDGKIVLYFQDTSNVVRYLTTTIPGMGTSTKSIPSLDHPPQKLTHADIFFAESDRMFVIICGPGPITTTHEKTIWTYEVEVDIRANTMHIHPSVVISVATPPLFLSNSMSEQVESSILSLHVLNQRTVLATIGRKLSTFSSHQQLQDQKFQGAICLWGLIETDAPPSDDGGIFGQDRDAKVITWVLKSTHTSLTSFPTAMTCLNPWHNPIDYHHNDDGSYVKSLIAIGYADGTLELRDTQKLKLSSSLYEYRFGPLQNCEKEFTWEPLPQTLPQQNVSNHHHSKLPLPLSLGFPKQNNLAARQPSFMIKEDDVINHMMDRSSSTDDASISATHKNEEDVDTALPTLVDSPEAQREAIFVKADSMKLEDNIAHHDNHVLRQQEKIMENAHYKRSILGLATSPNGVNILIMYRSDDGQVELDVMPMIETTTVPMAADPKKIIAELTRQFTLTILNKKDAQDLVDLIQVLTSRLLIHDLPERVMEGVYRVIGKVLRPTSPPISCLFPHPELSDMNIEGRVVGMQLLLYRRMPGRQTQFATTFIMIQLCHILKTFFQCCTDFWQARTTLFNLVKDRSCVEIGNTSITIRKEFLHYFVPMARWSIELVCLLLREFYMTINIRRRKRDVNGMLPTMNNTSPSSQASPTPAGLSTPPSAAGPAGVGFDEVNKKSWRGEFENQDLLHSRPTRLALLFHTPSRRLIMAVLLSVRLFRMQMGFNIASVKNQYTNLQAAQNPQRQKLLDQLRNDIAYLQRAELLLSRARLKNEAALSFLFDIDDIMTRQREFPPPMIINGVDLPPPDISLDLNEKQIAYDTMMIRSIVPPPYSATLPYIKHKYEQCYTRFFNPTSQKQPGPEAQSPLELNVSALLVMFASGQTWMELKPLDELEPFNEFYFFNNNTNNDDNAEMKKTMKKKKEEEKKYLDTLRQGFDVISKTNSLFAKGIRQCTRCCHTSACTDVDNNHYNNNGPASQSTGVGSALLSEGRNASKVGVEGTDRKPPQPPLLSPLSNVQISFKGKAAPWGEEYDSFCVCGGSWKRIVVSTGSK